MQGRTDKAVSTEKHLQICTENLQLSLTLNPVDCHIHLERDFISPKNS